MLSAVKGICLIQLYLIIIFFYKIILLSLFSQRNDFCFNLSSSYICQVILPFCLYLDIIAYLLSRQIMGKIYFTYSRCRRIIAPFNIKSNLLVCSLIIVSNNLCMLPCVLLFSLQRIGILLTILVILWQSDACKLPLLVARVPRCVKNLLYHAA